VPACCACWRHTVTTFPCLLALAKHVTVGGGNDQRSRWHLAAPKVGRQGRARARRQLGVRNFAVGIEQAVGLRLP
jgi:hypothetical protein